MNEKLLQYIWNFKLFSSFDFADEAGNSIQILDFGKWNFNSGPDFTFGKIKHGGLTLAGNIELHVKSSDWIFHKHSGNPEFKNLILHAVYENDVDLDEMISSGIPTLELKNYISAETIAKYSFLQQQNSFIPCENIFSPDAVPFQFTEESLIKKLDQKSTEIEDQLKKFKNNYEAVLFHNLAYAFGLKVNAQIFRQLVEGIDFNLVRKIQQNHVQLEALLFGSAGWLEKSIDSQTEIWKKEFESIKSKYRLDPLVSTPKFLRLRPPNFPTIRLSQLAHLYHSHTNIFSKVIHAKSTEKMMQIFENMHASEYWDDKFNFGKKSTVTGQKKVSKSFIELILINAVLPLKYTYYKYRKEDILEEILSNYRDLQSEQNTVVNSWKDLGCKIDTAGESQAFIFHYHNFCLERRCLECGIGLNLLK